MGQYNGTPIDVAAQLITATCKRPITPFEKAARKAFGVEAGEEIEEDAFTIDELEEIALHLLVYCRKARGENDE